MLLRAATLTLFVGLALSGLYMVAILIENFLIPECYDIFSSSDFTIFSVKMIPILIGAQGFRLRAVLFYKNCCQPESAFK